MKKIVVGLLTGLLLAGALTGCSLTSVKIQEGNTVENYNDTVEISGSEPESDTVLYIAKLLKQYFITYEVSDEDGIVTVISKAVDADGNIYYKAGEEYLFLYEGENFILYQREGEAFVKQEDKKYQTVYVDNLTEEFENYVKKANLNTGGITKLVGEEEVAGRKCNIYEIVVKVLNFEQRYQFAIDQGNYICLSWKSVKNISGYGEAGDESFLCTRFDTEGIDLKKEFLTSENYN